MLDDFLINVNGVFYLLNIVVVLEIYDMCCFVKMNKLLNLGISLKISFYRWMGYNKYMFV